MFYIGFLDNFKTLVLQILEQLEPACLRRHLVHLFENAVFGFHVFLSDDC